MLGRLHRQGEPEIVLGLAPAGEGQPPGPLQRAPQVGEGRLRVLEEHHAEAGEQHIDRLGRLPDLAIAFGEADVGELLGRGRLTRDVEQHGRGVNADHLAGSDLAGDLQGGLAAAAADIQDDIPRHEPRLYHGRPADGIELAVQPLVQHGPGAAHGVVPVGDLLGVGGLGHGIVS